MKTVAIIFGGVSSEYEVSLKSATAIIEAMKDITYKVIKIGITREGKWLIFEGTIAEIEKDTWFLSEKSSEIYIDFSKKAFITRKNGTLIQPDILFPVLHGGSGENGAMQATFEMMEIPYVGCGVAASAISMNKMMLHQFAQTVGVESTPTIMIRDKNEIQRVNDFIDEYGFPIYIKPNEAGSSKGISKVIEQDAILLAIEEAHKFDSNILIQKEVKGVEIGCAIMGNENLVIGECDQIRLVDGFFDYEEKYNLVTAEIVLPAEISKELKDEIKENAKKLYLSLGCKGLSRIDFFLTEKGEILLNEINTMPGFTEHSRFPLMMKEVGIGYKDIIETLLELGEINHEAKLSKIGE